MRAFTILVVTDGSCEPDQLHYLIEDDENRTFHVAAITVEEVLIDGEEAPA